MKHNFSSLKPLLSRIDLVTWDCDGTLVDNEARALDVIREEINRFVKKVADPDIQEQYRDAGVDCCRQYAGMSLPQIRAVVGRLVGVEIPESVDHAIVQRRLRSPEPEEQVRPVQILAELATFFNQHNVPQIVVTSSERDRAMRYITAAKLHHLFDREKQWLVSGHDDFTPPKHKPRPDAHRMGRELFAAHPARTLGLEDSLAGVHAGAADGIPTIGHLLASHIADHRKSDIASQMMAAGAAAIVYKPSDLVGALGEILNRMPARPGQQTNAVQTYPNLRVVGGRDYV